MPAGQGKDAERFAAAVEQGTPPGYAGDDDLARELEIVAMLRSSGSAFAPDPEAKARAKQRLMAMFAEEQGQQRQGAPRRPVPPPTAMETTAPMGVVLQPSFPSPRTEIDAAAETTRLAPVTPRQPVVDETEEVDEAAATAPTTVPSSGSSSAGSPGPRAGRRSRHSVASRPAGRARNSGRPAPSLRRRVALVSTAALVMMIALTGGGIIASRDALPGDSLYALKRVAESAELALTFDETERAQRHLQFAATRLYEVEQLIARDPKGADPQMYKAAIQEFDAAAGEGSSMLLTSAGSGGNPAQIDQLHSWASEQSAKLTELRPALPAPAAADADGSIQLLDQLLGRTEALGAPSACSDAGAGTPLGPVPAEGDCTPRSVNQSGPNVPGPGRTDVPASPDVKTPAPSGVVPAPSGAPTETPDEGAPGLLPDLRPDQSGSGSSGSDEGDSDGDGSSETTDPPAPGGGGDGVNVPLPLLPPITLPPLLPGMPPITIG